MVENEVVDLGRFFLPKDRDAAIRSIAEKLYRLRDDADKEGVEWVAFRIENILDIIERS